MENPENEILLRNFEHYLFRKYRRFYKEVPFTRLMKTKRIFRADYFIKPNIIIEINGGHWMIKGRHN